MAEKEKIQKQGFLNESPGVLSMRRLLSLIFTILAVVVSILLIVFNFTGTWQTYLVIIGIPIAAVIILALCTTAQDITDAISAIKGEVGTKKEKEKLELPHVDRPDPNEY